MITEERIRYCTVGKGIKTQEIVREKESFPMIKVGGWLLCISADFIILSDIVGPIVGRMPERWNALRSFAAETPRKGEILGLSVGTISASR